MKMLLADKSMGTPKDDGWRDVDFEFAVEYLEADRRNTVVFRYAPKVGHAAKHHNVRVAVWRGASGRLDNFFWQRLPLDSPDTSDAGTAYSTVMAAVGDISD